MSAADDTGTPPAAAATFSAPSRKGGRRKQFRARPRGEEQPDGESMLKKLDEIKMLQRERESQRLGGVAAETLASPEGGTKDSAPVVHNEQVLVGQFEEGLLKPTQAVSASLPSGGKHAEMEEMNLRMEKFIADRLKSELKDEAGSSTAPTSTPQQTEQQEARIDLYKTPEHLQAASLVKKDAEHTNWLAGITEVELPIEYKLRNIEETEEAKRSVVHQQRAQSGGSNFHFLNGSRDQFDQMAVPNYAEEPASHSTAAGGAAPRAPETRKRELRATDDLAVARFKKRFRFYR
eukprot:TRINITY_DN4452_c0_g1_i3.p1 TRINITY_DN4452_c0_g1~~TRINITY_DN4452_c0_g1_i3.p1  ORF type:complete len:292 (+),score=111.82 TRINITY_DN4452_c0_g1_i3:16-891(+)